MPRITKVYTRSGDAGETSLVDGSRVAKTCKRIAAYGLVDELSSHLGVVLATGISPRGKAALLTIQNELFHAGCDLATPLESEIEIPRLRAEMVDALESLMDELSAELLPLENFVLPGGCPSAAALHVSRAVCRRAEIEVLNLAQAEELGEIPGRYLNRLSDALFVLARWENHAAGIDEPIWNSRA